jgi:predicted O-methyltransferase YrrM
MPEWERWYADKSFTTDWTTNRFDSWSAILAPLRHREVDILEIGSWEGRSAIFFLEFFQSSHLTCIDTFRGGREHSDTEFDLASVEKRFEDNTAVYGPRVEKIKSRSVAALDRLAQDGRSFDIVYIDGSHQREDVMADSSLAWKILKPDGYVIWDDYLWESDGPAADRPQRAIEAFLVLLRGEIKIIQFSGQVIAQKQPADLPAELNVPGWIFPRTPRNMARFLLKKPIGSFG